jgi:hypothetical protein
VYIKVPGSGCEPSDVRSALAKGLRENSRLLRSRLGAHPGRNTCGYTGEALSYERGDTLPQAEIEHICEGQMDAHVLVYCDNAELQKRLDPRKVNLDLPGVIQKSVLAPFFHVHNGDPNLTFASHLVNMRKEKPVERALQRLDTGQRLERDLRSELAISLGATTKAGPGLPDGVAERAARVITDRMKTAEEEHRGVLLGVTAEEPAFELALKGDRVKLVKMYADISEDRELLLGCLFDT